jgi:hypothetical protein
MFTAKPSASSFFGQSFFNTNALVCIFFATSILFVCGCASTTVTGRNASTPVRATGVGSTVESAKENAFRQAIENKIGVLVLSEKEIKNFKLNKDDILTFSAGFIDDYNVISKEKLAAKWVVTIDAWVSGSRLANKITAISSVDGSISGKKAADRFDSFIKQKQQADRLLQKMLSRFPEDAIQVRFLRTDMKFDAERRAQVFIYFETAWSKAYVTSLLEMLTLLQDTTYANSFVGVVNVSHKKADDWFGSVDTFYFLDRHLFFTMLGQLDNSKVALRLKIRDGRTVVHEDCWPLDNQFISHGYGSQLGILGNRIFESKIQMEIPYGSSAYRVLESASNITLSIDSADRCSRSNAKH